MKQRFVWDRRRFVQMAGLSTVMGAVSGKLGWAMTGGHDAARFAYAGAEDGIHVYAIASGRWVEQQVVESANPVALAVRAGHLYVANGIAEYGSLPRGTVEAYAIDAVSGRLTRKSRVALSLSGTMPRDLAVAPDGRSLVVAVGGGGAYNVLPIEADGGLGRVSGILKETGSGPHAAQASARPESVMFDRAGRVLAADMGADRVSVLALREGDLQVTGRSAAAAGSGPSRMAMDPNGRRMYVAHALDGSIACLGYDAATGTILGRQQVVAVTSAQSGTAALAMHPAGELLYTAQGAAVAAWRIAPNGSLHALPGAEVAAHTLSVSADGRSLLALSQDGVLRMTIDRASGALGAAERVASLAKPVSFALA